MCGQSKGLLPRPSEGFDHRPCEEQGCFHLHEKKDCSWFLPFLPLPARGHFPHLPPSHWAPSTLSGQKALRICFNSPLLGTISKLWNQKFKFCFYLTILPDVSCGLTDVPFTRKLNSWDFECYGHCCYRQWFCQGRIWTATFASFFGLKMCFSPGQKCLSSNSAFIFFVTTLISGL